MLFMKPIINTFFEDVVPGLLKGEIDAEVLVHIIANVYFKEDDRLLPAKAPCDGLWIPTLVVNDVNTLSLNMSKYIDLMLKGDWISSDFVSVDKLPTYIIANALANMTEDDYLKPEEYFKKLCYIRENNPIGEDTYQEYYNDFLMGNIIIRVKEEKPNLECPYVMEMYYKNEENNFQFPLIRFYIENDTAYIGCIQNKKMDIDQSFQKKIRRKLYKVNNGINQNDIISQVDPAVVCAFTIFIAFLRNYGINKVIAIPYNKQRINDKKILLNNLGNINDTMNEKYRAKVVSVIENIYYYFERLPKLEVQFSSVMQRFINHFSYVTMDNNELDVTNIGLSNNELLNSLYTMINKNISKKM